MTARPSASRARTGVRRVADVQLRGRSGPLPARAYWPVPSPGAGAPALLVLLPAEGGRDGLGRAEARARGLCAHTGALVLSVGYRPPAGGAVAVEDAVTATQWAEDHAAELGADSGRLLLAGEGAGARLSVAVAQRARDDGWPPLARQVLICADLADGPPTDRGEPGPDGEPGRTVTAGRTGEGDHGRDGDDRLAGLVATTVVTAGAGRRDGDGVAGRLRAAGVEVDELQYNDVRPGDVLAPGGGPVAERIARDLGRSLRSAGADGEGAA